MLTLRDRCQTWSNNPRKTQAGSFEGRFLNGSFCKETPHGSQWGQIERFEKILNITIKKKQVQQVPLFNIITLGIDLCKGLFDLLRRKFENAGGNNFANFENFEVVPTLEFAITIEFFLPRHRISPCLPLPLLILLLHNI